MACSSFFSGDFSQHRSGSSEQRDYLDSYVRFLTKDILIPDIRLAVDVACGSAGMLVDAIAAAVHLDIQRLCFFPCDAPRHDANPMKDENTNDLTQAVLSKKADMGVAFDGDGDRIFFFDSGGKRIPVYAVAALLAKDFLALRPKSVIVTDVRMPKAFSEAVCLNGGTVIESRAGHTFIKHAMKKHRAIFAAELSGHFYFSDFLNADSAALTLMRVLHLIATNHQPLAVLAQPFYARFQSGELSYNIINAEKAITALRNAFSDGVMATMDGLSVSYSDWWFNIRPSNTEPLLRLNIEADTKTLLEAMRKKIEGIIIAIPQ